MKELSAVNIYGAICSETYLEPESYISPAQVTFYFLLLPLVQFPQERKYCRDYYILFTVFLSIRYSTQLYLSSLRYHCVGGCWDRTQRQYFETFKEPRNRSQGIDSASLCSLAGRYDNPIPTRFLASIVIQTQLDYSRAV